MKIKKVPVTAESNTAKVNGFMQQLDHPLKPEIEKARSIILHANKKIAERIKWNAPSFYYHDDIATFNPRNKQQVHVVFHYAPVISVKSELLTGDYRDRRMVYLNNMEEVMKYEAELVRIMNELTDIIDKQIINH